MCTKSRKKKQTNLQINILLILLCIVCVSFSFLRVFCLWILITIIKCTRQFDTLFWKIRRKSASHSACLFVYYYTKFNHICMYSKEAFVWVKWASIKTYNRGNSWIFNCTENKRSKGVLFKGRMVLRIYKVPYLLMLLYYL